MANRERTTHSSDGKTEYYKTRSYSSFSANPLKYRVFIRKYRIFSKLKYRFLVRHENERKVELLSEFGLSVGCFGKHSNMQTATNGEEITRFFFEHILRKRHEICQCIDPNHHEAVVVMAGYQHGLRKTARFHSHGMAKRSMSVFLDLRNNGFR